MTTRDKSVRKGTALWPRITVKRRLVRHVKSHKRADGHANWTRSLLTFRTFFKSPFMETLNMAAPFQKTKNTTFRNMCHLCTRSNLRELLEIDVWLSIQISFSPHNQRIKSHGTLGSACIQEIKKTFKLTPCLKVTETTLQNSYLK